MLTQKQSVPFRILKGSEIIKSRSSTHWSGMEEKLNQTNLINLFAKAPDFQWQNLFSSQTEHFTDSPMVPKSKPLLLCRELWTDASFLPSSLEWKKMHLLLGKVTGISASVKSKILSVKLVFRHVLICPTLASCYKTLVHPMTNATPIWVIADYYTLLNLHFPLQK